jgi:predicted nucleic acid-binding protein
MEEYVSNFDPVRRALVSLVPDALQIAAAIEAEATAFVTNDRRLKVQELDVFPFDDYLA